MQDTFLKAYAKLTQPDIGRLSGLWLAYGDEPLLQQWLIDAMRDIWHRQSLAIKRVDLVSVKTWLEVLDELNSLSLFDAATAVIVTGNHKPDSSMQAELAQFGSEAADSSNQNCVLWLTGKVDKRAQASKWFAPFAKYGQVIDCNVYNENQRQQLLNIHAQHFGLTLSPEAWQFLMLQTEHHLLSAYQALWRLSYLFAPSLSSLSSTPSTNEPSRLSSNEPSRLSSNEPDNRSSKAPSNPITIDIDALQHALVSSAQFSVFDLSDAMLAGDALKVVNIIEQLKATQEPLPLVLWTLSKDMRLIMQLLDGQNAQSLGIWSSKQSLYQAAWRRQTPQSVSDWVDILYDCDKAIKGVIRQSAWELILQAALRVAGVRLFA